MPEPLRFRRSARILATVAAVVMSVISGGAPAIAAPIVDVRSLEWWLTPMGIPDAQKITQGEGVLVGLVDSGVDVTHPDLAGQILPGSGYYGGPDKGWGTDKAQNHGTTMAGLIVGRGGGATHMLGIAPKAKIIPYATSPEPEAKQVADGIRWVVDHGAKVINVSSAHSGDPESYEVEAVNYALSKDVVVVAGTGNAPQTGDGVGSPASIPGVIAVSGVRRNGNFWELSGTGPQVVVAAPGEYMISTVPKVVDPSGYLIYDGTSNATALVTGLVALIRAHYPKLDAANVINRVITTATDNGAPGRDPKFGFGTVRMRTSLTADVPAVKANPLGGAVAAPSPSFVYQPVKTRPSVTPVMKVLFFAVPIIILVLIVGFIVWVSRKKPKVPPPGPRPPAGVGPGNGRW